MSTTTEPARIASRLLAEDARATTVHDLIERQPEMWRVLPNSIMPTHDDAAIRLLRDC